MTFASATPAADKVVKANGSGLIDDGWLSSPLSTISGLATTDGNFIVGNGSTWVAESGSTVRASMGLGTIATQSAASVSITGGSIDGTVIGGSTAAAVTATTVSTHTADYLQLSGTSLSALGTSANVNVEFAAKGNGVFIFGSDTWAKNYQSSGAGSISLDNGTSDTPNLKFHHADNQNFAIDSAVGSLRFIRNADESGGFVLGTISSGAVFTLSTASSAMVIQGTSASTGAGTGALRCSGGAYFGAATVFGSTIQLNSYTVAGLPAAGTAGRMVYCTDETGGAIPVFDDGTNWRRVSDRAIAS